MIKYFKDPFDSKIFEKEVYKLIIEKFVSEKQIKNLFQKKSQNLVFCFTPFCNKNIKVLESLNFNFTSIRTTYKYRITKALKTNLPSSIFKINQLSKTPINLYKNNLKNLANILAQTSHYCKDPQLTSKKAEKLYITWLENSLYHKYADEAFYITVKNRCIGLITLKIKENQGFIDLIGLEKKFQHQGLGKSLLAKGINYFQNKKIKNLLAITEGENIPANRFYQKNTFIVDKIELVYHKHF